MKALLLADRDTGRLAPLTNHTCPAMLPVLGKPLVVHAVESLVAAGITDIIVAASDNAEHVEKELGSGTRFSASIRILLTRGNEGYDAIAARIGAQLGDDYIAMHADVLRSDLLPRFLSLSAEHKRRTLRATVDDQPCGLWKVRRGREWDEQDIELDGAHALAVDTLAAFHRANVDALQGRFPGLEIPGRQLPRQLTAHRHASLPWDLEHDGPVFAGRNCSVGPGARFGGTVVLSDNVLVNERAMLRDAVILPDTFVGPQVALENVIAWKTDLIHVESGRVEHVSDPMRIADMTSRAYSVAFRRVADKVAGAAILLLSLPLWVWMLGDSWRIDRKKPLHRVQLIGNRTTQDASGKLVPREFEVLEGATRIPVLRHLPRILAVISGDLALVGVQPLPPQVSLMRTEDWERVREGAPVGLLGPAPLGTPQNAADEDKLLLEALYAETRTGWSDLKWLSRGLLSLFTLRAWRLPIHF